MRSDKLWETTTQQELDVVSALVEKYFMCRIYVRYPVESLSHIYLLL